MPDAPLHIVFSLSARGSLVEGLKLGGLPDTVVGLGDSYAQGPIVDRDLETRKTFYTETLGNPNDSDEEFPDDTAFWAQSLDPSRDRIVWLSRWSTHEYCGFLEWLRRNDGAPFRLLDLTDATLPSLQNPSRQLPIQCTPLIRAETFAKYSMWSWAFTPNPDDLLAWQALWDRLRSENAPLRVITPEGLVSAPLDYFDAELLSYVEGKWIEARMVVALVLGAMMYDSFREGGVYQCGDLVLFSRLRDMVARGVLRAKGDVYGAIFKLRRA